MYLCLFNFDMFYQDLFLFFFWASQSRLLEKNQKQYAKMQLESDSSVILEKVLQAYLKIS